MVLFLSGLRRELFLGGNSSNLRGCISKSKIFRMDFATLACDARPALIGVGPPLRIRFLRSPHWNRDPREQSSTAAAPVACMLQC